LLPELRNQVIDCLPPRDVVSLASTSKQARVTYAEAAAKATTATLVMEASDANLETIDRLLNDPAGVTALPPSFQPEPRRAIAKRLGDLANEARLLPEPDQVALFSALLDRTPALGAEGGTALMLLTAHVTDLPEDARHDAFRNVANRLKLLPVEHPSRTIASLALCRSIPRLPAESRDEATRQIVEVLRPLPRFQRELVLAKPDDQLLPAIKDALRRAIAEDEATALSRAGTSAHA
jgi:hypothetical protein